MTNQNSDDAPRPSRLTPREQAANRADQTQQVHDQGTTDVPASEVANAAAESLHGARAVEEKYAQPDAKALPGGGTLVADPAGDNPEAGQLR